MKLTTEQVAEIRRRAAAGEKRYALAVEFKVAPSFVCDIVNFKKRKKR